MVLRLALHQKQFLVFRVKAVAGDRELPHESLDPHPRAIGIFHVEATAHTALGAGPQLDEVGLGQASVLDFLQHLNHVFDAVHRHIPLIEARGRTRRRSRPSPRP